MEETTKSWKSCTAAVFVFSNATSDIPEVPLPIAVFQRLYIAIGIVGIGGSLIALVVLLGHAPLRRKPANYFIINQTCIDFLASVIIIPMTTVDSTRMKGAVACYLWKNRVIFLCLFLASIFNISALTVERYFKIVHPILHRRWMTKTRLKCVVVVVSLAGILLKLPYVIGGTMYHEDNVCLIQFYPTRTIEALSGIYNWLVEYFFPLCVIAFCYIQMARSLRRNSQVTRGGGQSESRTMARTRKNIIKTLLFVVVVFIICTTWKQILILLRSTAGIRYDIAEPTFNVAQIMSYSVCCVDPFIYIFHYDEFKVGFRKIFFRRKVEPAVYSNQDESANTRNRPGDKF